MIDDDASYHNYNIIDREKYKQQKQQQQLQHG